MEDLNSTVEYIVQKGLEALQKNTEYDTLEIDFIDIFCQNQKEYTTFTDQIAALGTVVKEGPTGNFYSLEKPIQTPAGDVHLVKVRTVDSTRPQRGAPDFKVPDYLHFNARYRQADNFALVSRSNYEMLELKGEDVLVYFLSTPISDQVL